MRSQLERRLQELKAEFESGEKMLADIETQQANLKKTLLRISGAIQVLEEVLAEVESSKNGANSLEAQLIPSQPDEEILMQS